MRPPRLDRVTVERVLGKMRRMGSSRQQASSVPQISNGPRVLSPWMWPWFKRSWDRDLNRWLLRKQLAPLFQQSAPPTLALTT
ncbi:MAG: hypothetical protein ACK53L_15695, partial [Pirellulaceae bacterium]